MAAFDLADGWHKAKPIAWGLAPDREPGKEQFGIAFEVVEGEGQGQRITWYGTFATDKAFEYTMKAIRKCGWTGTDLASVELSEEPVSIKVETSTYEGKTRQKVAAIGSGGGGFVPMEANAARSFAAKMAAQIKAFDATHGGAPKAKPANGSAPKAQARPAQAWDGTGPDPSEDIPF